MNLITKIKIIKNLKKYFGEDIMGYFIVVTAF
jgi:hypothetical protein